MAMQTRAQHRATSAGLNEISYTPPEELFVDLALSNGLGSKQAKIQVAKKNAKVF
jgi:hypothetical protein